MCDTKPIDAWCSSAVSRGTSTKAPFLMIIPHVCLDEFPTVISPSRRYALTADGPDCTQRRGAFTPLRQFEGKASDARPQKLAGWGRAWRGCQSQDGAGRHAGCVGGQRERSGEEWASGGPSSASLQPGPAHSSASRSAFPSFSTFCCGRTVGLGPHPHPHPLGKSGQEDTELIRG